MPSTARRRIQTEIRIRKDAVNQAARIARPAVAAARE